MICGIYKITNKVNGKMYIGQSRDIENRWIKHKSSSKTVDSHLYSAMRKHGIDNFTFSIICEVPENVLDVYEISYIKYYETTDRTKGYNKTFGGDGGRRTVEIKNKISKSLKGKTLSDETKKKLSESIKKQYQYQGIIYNGLQELADFLGLKYKALSSRIHKKQIDVSILPKKR